MGTVALRRLTVFGLCVAVFCSVGLSTGLFGQAPAQPRPTEKPVVLGLDIDGQPTPVSAVKPVPVSLINTISPIPVLDGGLMIEGPGAYDFVFSSTMTFPGFPTPISGFRVAIKQVRGKWVRADYRLANGSTKSAWFNTEQLLAVGRVQ